MLISLLAAAMLATAPEPATCWFTERPVPCVTAYEAEGEFRAVGFAITGAQVVFGGVKQDANSWIVRAVTINDSTYTTNVEGACVRNQQGVACEAEVNGVPVKVTAVYD